MLNTDVGGREAHSWVTERIARAPVKLEPAAAAEVEEHLGEDLNRLGALLATLEAAYGTGATDRAGRARALPRPARLGATVGPHGRHRPGRDRGGPKAAAPAHGSRRPPPAGRPGHPAPPLRQHPAGAVAGHHFEGQAAEALGIAKGRSTFPARKALDAARRLGMRGSGDAVIALADAELALRAAGLGTRGRAGGAGGPAVPHLTWRPEHVSHGPDWSHGPEWHRPIEALAATAG